MIWAALGLVAVGFAFVLASAEGYDGKAVAPVVIWIGLGPVVGAVGMRSEAKRTRHMPTMSLWGRALGHLPLWAERLFWVVLGLVIAGFGVYGLVA